MVDNELFDVAIRRLDGGQQTVGSNREVEVALGRRGAGSTRVGSGGKWSKSKCGGGSDGENEDVKMAGL